MYFNKSQVRRSRILGSTFGGSASVAVIIAARNAADTIRATLDSLVEQSFPDWEAVIVNDGSTDATGRIAEEYARWDARLHVVNARHGGVSAARNAGIKATRAPWIMLLDADDQLQPWHLEGMMSTARDDASADAVHADWRIIGAMGQEGARQKVNFLGPPIRHLSRSTNLVVHGLMFRRDLLELTGLFQPGLPIAEDWDLWIRMARVGARFRPARPDVVARYTMRPGSACSIAPTGVESVEHVARIAATDDPRICTRLEVPPFGKGEFDATCIYHAVWTALRSVRSGRDPVEILKELAPMRRAAASDEIVKWMIFNTLQQALADPRPDWPAIWPDIRPRIVAMLDYIAPQTLSPLFAELTLKGAEELAVGQLDAGTLGPGQALQVGRWLLARVDLARLELPTLPAQADFARVQVDRDGKLLGEVFVYADRLSSSEKFAEIATVFADTPPFDPAERAYWQAAAEQPVLPNLLDGCSATATEADVIAAALRSSAKGKVEDVLLVAAGDGNLAAALVATGAQVRATESDPQRMRALRLKHLRTRGVRVNALDPLRDLLEGSHDLVILPTGLLGLTDEEARTTLLDRLWTVVAPGGRLAVVASGDADAGADMDADAIRLLLRERFALLPTMRRVGTREVIVAEKRNQGSVPAAAPYLSLPVRTWLSDSVPVLMYHRVANDPLPGLETLAVTPDEFAAQMTCLANMGATALTLDQFESFIWQGTPLPERPVLITFDDAYVDTLTEAVPSMMRAGMTATIFVPTAHVGGTAVWDEVYGPSAPLMTWNQLRVMRDLGFSLAAHSHNHVPMTALDHAALCRELDRPREMLRQELDIETRVLAYPYGRVDQAVEWEVFGAGYRLAFSTEGRRYSRRDKVMSIPRWDVARGLCLDRFARMVTG